MVILTMKYGNYSNRKRHLPSKDILAVGRRYAPVCSSHSMSIGKDQPLEVRGNQY